MNIYIIDYDDQSTNETLYIDEDNLDEFGITQATTEEQFLVCIEQKDTNTSSVILHNTRIDYQYRPENPILEKTCLYDFVANYEIEKKKEITNGQESNIHNKFPLLERFDFHNDHPLKESHVLKSCAHKIPVLLGPRIPNKNNEETKERYSRAILTLFHPWRDINDLCNINESWEEALLKRYNNITENSLSKIANIQLLHSCKEDKLKQDIQSDFSNLTQYEFIEREKLYEKQLCLEEEIDELLLTYINDNTQIDVCSNHQPNLKTYISEANIAAAKALKFKFSKSKFIIILCSFMNTCTFVILKKYKFCSPTLTPELFKLHS